MSRLPLVIVGLVGLVVGVVAGGALGIFEDTKTETATQTITNAQTLTKTVRKGGRAAAATKTVTRTQTVTAPGAPSAPGETPSGRQEVTTVDGTKTFTGKGTKNFGTLKVKKRSTLNWTNDGAVFSVISQSQLHVSSTKKKGSTRLFEGTYYQFRVAAVGHWKVTITPR